MNESFETRVMIFSEFVDVIVLVVNCDNVG